MKESTDYLMEHDDEIERLERKTDVKVIRRQARWAGIEPGMRVLDIGCGTGKTSFTLHRLVHPGGEVVGLDLSQQRLDYAACNYNAPGLHFVRRNVRAPLDDLGRFDFIWVRFFLEYHRTHAFDIVRNLAEVTAPGGIVCLIDLDYNCLNHFDMPDRLARAMRACMRKLETDADFDPYIGIKLYSFLYDLGFEGIDVTMTPHHLIYGELNEVDAFNWTQKIEVAVRRSGVTFEDYEGGYTQFLAEFKTFFADPRRFSYTPLIACRGRKPGNR